jgi:hypothetical protein
VALIECGELSLPSTAQHCGGLATGDERRVDGGGSGTRIAVKSAPTTPSATAGCGDRMYGDPVNGCRSCPANSNRATGGFAVFPAAAAPAGALGPCVCDSGYLAINFNNGTLQRCVLDCPVNYYVDATGEWKAHRQLRP